MNIQHLRHSLKIKWLLYYRQNRQWLVKLRIWGTYDGQRRPSSSFILATLSTSEPQLTQMLPFIVDLSNNPDQIVAALGLNFNPDAELKSMTETNGVAQTNANGNGLTEANGVAQTNANGNGLTETNGVAQTNANGNGLTEANGVAQTNANGNGLTEANGVAQTNANGNGLSIQVLPNVADKVSLSPSSQASNLPTWVDESCNGKGSPNAGLVLPILAVIGALVVMFVGFTG